MGVEHSKLKIKECSNAKNSHSFYTFYVCHAYYIANCMLMYMCTCIPYVRTYILLTTIVELVRNHGFVKFAH